MTNRIDPEKTSFLLKSPQFIAWRLNPSTELEEYWETYIENNPEDLDSLTHAIELFTHGIQHHSIPLAESDKVELYERINDSITHKKRQKKKNIFYSFLTTAAAIATLFFVLPLNKGVDEQINEYTDALIIKELPAQNIQLISGDKIVEFESNTNFSISKDAEISSSGEQGNNVLIPQTDQKKDVKNTIIVPYGKQSVLILADGSKLWLNAGTRVTFPTEFTGKTREISIVGEIYADVISNPSKPFIVHSPNTSVKVHGTEFNFSDYGEKLNNTEVVLVSGKVEILSDKKESLFLEPKDLYKKTGDKETISHNINLLEYTSWTNNLLIVKQKDIYEIFKYLERYYNVTFDNLGAIEKIQRSCSGKLFLSENIDDTMKGLAVLAKIQYEQNGKTIYINNKKYVE